MFKKLLLLSVVSLLLVGSVQAAQIGGIDPQANRWTLEGTVGFDQRDVEWTTNNADKGEIDRNIYVATIKYGFNDWISGYGRLGGSSLDYDDEANGAGVTGASGVANSTFSVDMGSSFTWGIGLQGIFWRQDPWRISGDIQYQGTSDQSDNYSLGGVTYNWDADLAEVQGSLIISYQYMQALPYAGIQWSDWDMDYTRNAGTPATLVASSGTIEGEDQFGGLVGCDFYFEQDWKLNLEGHFGDYTGFAAALGYTF